MSPKLLNAMMKEIETKHNIYSFTIVRNGYLVKEWEAPGTVKEYRHNLYDATAGILSILTGIALDRGYLKSIDQPILDFFPEEAKTITDKEKQAITIRHLLTMTSGLDTRNGLGEQESLDLVDHLLNLPLRNSRHVEGKAFEYSLGSAYLLSKILHKALGISTFEFAKKNLFHPLGITNVSWYEDDRGVHHAYWLRMRPQDMAKIGWLLLNQGRWDGKQIVSAKWIEESTKAQVLVETLFEDEHYGYLWWIKDGYYMVRGDGGQYIFVLPDKNMVVTFTGNLIKEQIPQKLLLKYIIPATPSIKRSLSGAVAKLNRKKANVPRETLGKAINESSVTNQWPQSTPKEQGMDDQLLDAVFHRIETTHKLYSVTIVRNGYLVKNWQRASTVKNYNYHIPFCGNMITALLVGIAIDQGYLKSLDQPVIEFFPDKINNLRDKERKAITIRHLLTMSSGLSSMDSYENGAGLREMTTSRDWVRHVLNLPMTHSPGKGFASNTETVYLLSAVLHKALNQSIFEFAKKNLFEPLGIVHVTWEGSRDGVHFGSLGLQMRTEDMAKVAWLYVNRGKWQNRQIVSPKWIEESTKKQVKTNSQYAIKHYGYHWWIDNEGYYHSIGTNGAYIIVVPEKKLVVTFAGDLPYSQLFLPKDLMGIYIIPSTNTDIQ